MESTCKTTIAIYQQVKVWKSCFTCFKLPWFDESWGKVRTANATLNVRAQSYVPQLIASAIMPPLAEPLAQYLTWRDLVNSGLYQFHDEPKKDHAWYSSVTDAAGKVDLTAISWPFTPSQCTKQRFLQSMSTLTKTAYKPYWVLSEGLLFSRFLSSPPFVFIRELLMIYA